MTASPAPVAGRARRSWGLWIAAGLGLAAYGGLAHLDATAGTLRDGFTPRTAGWYLVAFAAFVAALWWAERRSVRLLWLWAIPIAFRLLLIPTTPTLSDDVYRYLWEGHVAASGVSPYAHPIDAPELDHLHIPARDLANNPSLASPYLPAAHATFATAALVAPSSPTTMQVVMVGFDLAAAGVVAALLRLAALPRRRVMLYLWNPLVIVEVAHGAHLDALMVFLALLAVYLTLSRPAGAAAWAAPLLLAAATLTRPLPILLAPVLWPRWRPAQRVGYAAVVVGALVPFGLVDGWGLAGDATGTGLFGSIRAFSGWVFNSASHEWIAGSFAADVAGTRLVTAALGAVVLAVVAMRARRDLGPASVLRLMAVPLVAYTLLSPTFHPWYLIALVAFLPFVVAEGGWRHWLAAAPWLYLTGALVLSYLTYLDPDRHAELTWVRRVEWLPVFALLAAAGVVLAARRSAAPAPVPAAAARS